jgi:hypothetical protein
VTCELCTLNPFALGVAERYHPFPVYAPVYPGPVSPSRLSQVKTIIVQQRPYSYTTPLHLPPRVLVPSRHVMSGPAQPSSSVQPSPVQATSQSLYDTSPSHLVLVYQCPSRCLWCTSLTLAWLCLFVCLVVGLCLCCCALRRAGWLDGCVDGWMRR